MTTIRLEKPEDASQIRNLNDLAFGQPAEGALVDRLRLRCPEAISLVSEDDAIVGHIMFTPVEVADGGVQVVGMGLGPMAVLPGRQRQGIGSQLVRRGLDLVRQRGCPFVVVVGHPEFYPRFGFERASAHGLVSQWDGMPDAAFMAIIMDATAMHGAAGVARYRDEFDEVT